MTYRAKCFDCVSCTFLSRSFGHTPERKDETMSESLATKELTGEEVAELHREYVMQS